MVASPIDMLHNSMSQPVAVGVASCDSLPILQQAIDAVGT
jgi:hypothetical protein